MSGKRLPKGLLPILIVVVGIVGAVLMIKLKPEPPRRPVVETSPLVRTEIIGGETPRALVEGYGEARARRRIDLVARVSGQVVRKSPDLRSGAYFEAGDTLLVIEQDDYRLARDMAAAGVATAEYNLARAEQEAEIARDEWNARNAAEDAPSRARPNPLVLHAPQLKLARANLASARAGLEKATLDLERCLVVAPFSGRVIDEVVDVGQYLGPGARIGSIYAADMMEIAVPVEDRDLALFDAPRPGSEMNGADVRVLAEFAGAPREWSGRVLRTAGEVDRQSRMVNVVVGVDNTRQPEGTPHLLEGMFVEVRIDGHRVPGSVSIPREARHENDTVWIVEDSGLLSIRDVTVFFKDRERAILSSGVSAGERIVLSQMDIVSEGMRIRTGGERPKTDAPIGGEAK